MAETAVALPDVKEIEKQTNSLMARVEALRINDNNTYMEAGDLLLLIKARQKQIEPILQEPVSVQMEALKKVRDWRDRYLAPVETMRLIVARKIGEWDAKIREKRRKEAEEAEAKARLEAEKKRDADIKKAKAQGDRDTVKNLQAAPLAPVVAAPKTAAPPKIAGVTTVYRWTYEVVDQNRLNREYLEPNHRAIRKTVEGLGKNAQSVLGPGVRVFEEPVTSGRA